VVKHKAVTIKLISRCFNCLFSLLFSVLLGHTRKEQGAFMQNYWDYLVIKSFTNFELPPSYIGFKQNQFEKILCKRNLQHYTLRTRKYLFIKFVK